MLEQAAGRDRDQQGWSNLVSKGGEGSLSCAWALDTCRRAPQTEVCAPLVLSEPSQVEHPDLEPEHLDSSERMRSSSRKSHVLSREARARSRSADTQRGTARGHDANLSQLCPARRGTPDWSTFTTCSGGLLRVQEDPPSPGLIPGRTFRWAEQPEGPHDGSQQKRGTCKLHQSKLPVTLTCRGCMHPHPLEQRSVRRHVLLALPAS